MIDFSRFWSENRHPDFDEDVEDFDPEEPRPGVTADELANWEHTHGVTMPEPLRTALGLRDGGSVRGTTIHVLPIAEIVPAEEEFWQYTDIEEDDAPDRDLVFLLGHDDNVGGTYYLNFNENGPHGPPSVYIDYHGESTQRVGDSIAELLESALASTDVPEVDWSEAVEDLAIVARETIDLSSMYKGKPASMDQVLARRGESLILFTRERSPLGEELTRTTLPLPLDALWAEVQPLRPGPISTFALHLQPVETDGVVHVESRTDEDKRWKSTTNHGVPIYVHFESTDRDRLQSLRSQLVGAEAASRAQARQDDMSKLTASLDALTPEQRSAAMIQAALNLKAETDRGFEAAHPDLGPAPPELAGALEAMRLRMQSLAEQARKKAAADPADPEAVRRIEDLLRGQMPD